MTGSLVHWLDIIIYRIFKFVNDISIYSLFLCNLLMNSLFGLWLECSAKRMQKYRERTVELMEYLALTTTDYESDMKFLYEVDL